MPDPRQLEAMIWRIVDGVATTADDELLRADEAASLLVIDRLVEQTSEQIESIRRLPENEREAPLADFAEVLRTLEATAAIFRPSAPTAAVEAAVPLDDEVCRLQATWSNGDVVVWAGGRNVNPEPVAGVHSRLDAVEGPAHGRQPHPGVTLPNGEIAEAVAIPMQEALGWLVAVAAAEVASEEADEPVGPSVRWLGRVAVEAVRLATAGAIVPTVAGEPPQRRSSVRGARALDPGAHRRAAPRRARRWRCPHPWRCSPRRRAGRRRSA